MNTHLDHHPSLPLVDVSSFDFGRPELRIPAWAKSRWPKLLQAVAFSIAFLAAWLVGLAATGSALESYAIVMLLYFASVIAHETGHWLGAMATGRRVIAAQLSWIALWRLRRGWRVRLSRPRHVAGWVWAVAAEGQASRAATALFIAGGVFANAALVAAGLLGYAFAGSGGGWVGFVLVAINLAMILASLTPHAAQYFTDGLHLLAIAQGKRSAKASDLLEHIVARAIAGRVDLPPAEIDGLLREPGTALFGRYLVICAHVRKGADDLARTEAAAAKQAFDELQSGGKIAAMPVMELIRFELAMIDADLATLRSIRIDKHLEFRAPYFSLRRQAFLAALEGDASTAEQVLARHEASSENSIDAGARASERAWRERIRDLLRKRTAGHGS